MDHAKNMERVIKKGLSTFVWVTNTGSGGYYHEKYKQLKENGLPIIFSEEAYDSSGRILKGCIAVFVEKNSRKRFKDQLDKIVSGKLEKARREAHDGDPTTTLLLLLEAGADEATQREFLALAYEKRASNQSWYGRKYKSKEDKNEARRKFKFAKKLREGKVGIYLLSEEQEMTKMLAFYLSPGEEFITNASDGYSGFSSGDSASEIAARLDGSDRWESARVLNVAFDRNGKDLQHCTAVVGIRRHGEKANR